MMAFRPVAKTFLFFISFVIVISIKKLSNVHKFCYVLGFFFFLVFVVVGWGFLGGGGCCVSSTFKEGKSRTSSSSFSFYR